jgi:hypothetical protein
MNIIIKYKNHLILFTVLAATFLNACNRAFTPYCGKVHYIGKEYDSNNKDLNSKVSRFPEFYAWWYKDSFAIEEIKKLSFRTENDSTTVERIFIYYQFVDLKKASFYLYHHFSDTAVFFEKFDTSKPYIAGINFFDTSNQYSPLVRIKDTVINNIVYKRHKDVFQTDSAFKSETTIFYERYDRKRVLFDLGNGNIYSSVQFSNAVTRFDILPTTKVPITISWEINFERDSLTQKELKVFAAWAKNARENPVTKSDNLKRNSW